MRKGETKLQTVVQTLMIVSAPKHSPYPQCSVTNGTIPPRGIDFESVYTGTLVGVLLITIRGVELS